MTDQKITFTLSPDEYPEMIADYTKGIVSNRNRPTLSDVVPILANEVLEEYKEQFFDDDDCGISLVQLVDAMRENIPEDLDAFRVSYTLVQKHGCYIDQSFTNIFYDYSGERMKDLKYKHGSVVELWVDRHKIKPMYEIGDTVHWKSGGWLDVTHSGIVVNVRPETAEYIVEAFGSNKYLGKGAVRTILFEQSQRHQPRPAVAAKCPKCAKYSLIMVLDPGVIIDSSDDVISAIAGGHSVIHTDEHDARDNYGCECEQKPLRVCVTCGSVIDEVEMVNGRYVCVPCMKTKRKKK